MPKVNYFFRWSWLLFAALLLPVDLPAGGNLANSYQNIRRKSTSNEFFAGHNCILKVSPLEIAPTLSEVELGTSLKVLRSWTSADGKRWVQVQLLAASNSIFSSGVSKGWINV